MNNCIYSTTWMESREPRLFWVICRPIYPYPNKVTITFQPYLFIHPADTEAALIIHLKSHLRPLDECKSNAYCCFSSTKLWRKWRGSIGSRHSEMFISKSPNTSACCLRLSRLCKDFWWRWPPAMCGNSSILQQQGANISWRALQGWRRKQTLSQDLLFIPKYID